MEDARHYRSAWWKSFRVVLIKIDKKECFIPVNRNQSKSGYLNDSHRQIFQAAFGISPNGFVVRHLCNNRRCLNPDHLAIGTHADNVRDRVMSHHSARGERNGRSKLTKEQVEKIRSDKTTPQIQLARNFDVSPRLIGMIKRGKLWTQTRHKPVNPMILDRQKYQENQEVICTVN